MAMDELCCFALVVAQLPDSGEIEELQVNLFHKNMELILERE
jgi:hypothetical protein